MEVWLFFWVFVFVLLMSVMSDDWIHGNKIDYVYDFLPPRYLSMGERRNIEAVHCSMRTVE